MNINDAFPRKYLSASDLKDGQQPIVAIASVASEAVGRDKELKPVVYFQGKEKGLVLNKTNARKIADIAGSPDTNNWRGVKIKLYATETEFSGEQVVCIRIKSPNGAAAIPAPPPVPVTELTDDDIPF